MAPDQSSAASLFAALIAAPRAAAVSATAGSRFAAAASDAGAAACAAAAFPRRPTRSSLDASDTGRYSSALEYLAIMRARSPAR